MEEVIHPVEEVIHTLVILESAQGPNPSFFFLFDFYLTWEPVGTRIWTRA